MRSLVQPSAVVSTTVRVGRKRVAVSRSGTAMGTACRIDVVDDSFASAGALSEQLWWMLTELDRRWSRFVPTSEVSRMNAGSAAAPEGSYVLLSDGGVMSVLLSAAAHAFRVSGGLVDAGVLPALCVAGYDRTFTDLDTATVVSPATAEPFVSFGRVRRYGDTFLAPAGFAFDPGGVGKGVAADVLCEAAADCAGVMVDVGGDIRARGTDEHGEPWTVWLSDERNVDAGVLLGSVCVSDQAVATSSTARRRWAGGHHLIDPRTSLPSASDVLAATVVAPTCVEAETWSKTAVLSGSAAAVALLSTQGDIAGVLTLTDGTTVPFGSLPDGVLR